jgi:hypothetical protein
VEGKWSAQVINNVVNRQEIVKIFGLSKFGWFYQLLACVNSFRPHAIETTKPGVPKLVKGAIAFNVSSLEFGISPCEDCETGPPSHDILIYETWRRSINGARQVLQECRPQTLVTGRVVDPADQS